MRWRRSAGRSATATPTGSTIAGNRPGALRDYDATGLNGPNGDPDGDGRTNAQEQAAGTHPRGFAQRYLAEGATSVFFETRIGVLNPSPTFTARVQLRYQMDNGMVQTDRVTLAPRTRRTLTPPAESLFSTLLVSDQPWSRSHDGVGPERPLRQPRRIVAGGAGAGLVLRRRRDARRLRSVLSGAEPQRPARRGRRPLPPRPDRRGRPVSRHYTVGAHQRLTINADFVPGLEAVDVSGEFHSINGTPIIVERAMYLSRGGELWTAGIDGTGVTALGTNWFLAEGSTGTFFDTFVQVANPSTDARPDPRDVPAAVRRSAGAARLHRAGPRPPDHPGRAGRSGTGGDVGVDDHHSTNGVPVVAERSMWWPGSDWIRRARDARDQRHRHGVGRRRRRSGIADNARTYLLVASGQSATADSLRVILVRDAGPPLERIYTDALTPNARLTIDLSSAFPNVLDEHVGVILESMGQTSGGAVTPMPIVVDARCTTTSAASSGQPDRTWSRPGCGSARSGLADGVVREREVDGQRHADRLGDAVQQGRRIAPLPDRVEGGLVEHRYRPQHPGFLDGAGLVDHRLDDHDALHLGVLGLLRDRPG